jgi:hypothetical protein
MISPSLLISYLQQQPASQPASNSNKPASQPEAAAAAAAAATREWIDPSMEAAVQAKGSSCEYLPSACVRAPGQEQKCSVAWGTKDGKNTPTGNLMQPTYTVYFTIPRCTFHEFP